MHWHLAIYEGDKLPRRVVVRLLDHARAEKRIEESPPIEGRWNYPKRRVEIVACSENCLGELRPKTVA